MRQNERIGVFLVISVTIKEKHIGPSMKTTSNDLPAFDSSVSRVFDDTSKANMVLISFKLY